MKNQVDFTKIQDNLEDDPQDLQHDPKDFSNANKVTPPTSFSLWKDFVSSSPEEEIIFTSTIPHKLTKTTIQDLP